MLFSIGAAPICIPTNSGGVFPFLHTLSSIYCLMIALLTKLIFVHGLRRLQLHSFSCGNLVVLHVESHLLKRLFF